MPTIGQATETQESEINVIISTFAYQLTDMDDYIDALNGIKQRLVLEPVTENRTNEVEKNDDIMGKFRILVNKLENNNKRLHSLILSLNKIV